MGRLLEEFNVRVKNNNIELNDYNLFKDKELLDTFRIKILEILSDKGFINENGDKQEHNISVLQGTLQEYL